MSGICGIVHLDGGPIAPGEIAGMTKVLERRGPDGTRTWESGSVALGHTLLATTPEALVERLPLTDAASGCTITADVRLDNREELIPVLGLENESRVVGDGELILRAYLKWGEDCPKHLLGDFAFAIWDPRSQRLFCARDHMGMRQFNYCHLPGQVFVFSTEDTGVLAHPSVPRDLDEGRIADFIADREDVDFTSTFFESVLRLPAAHTLIVGSRACDLCRYWTLHAGPPLQLESDAAYAEAFMAVFSEAVRCRLRTDGGVAAMLSGGLDSSAVTAVAARILSAAGQGPLTTISAVGPDPAECAETQAIHSALSLDGLRPILVTLDDLHRMADELIAELENIRNPFELNGTMLRSIYRTARDNGIKVVLDGGSGDVILTSDNRIAALLSEGKLRLAIREAVGLASFWKVDKSFRFAARHLMRSTWVAYAPLRVRSVLRVLRTSGHIPGAAPGFASRARFAGRRRLAARHLSALAPNDPEWRAQNILHPHLVAGRERYDQLAASFETESRDPFMDIRVIKFCLTLPADQLQSDGWPKVVLRRALEKLMPRHIAWRQGKEHLGWDFTTALLSGWKEWPDSMCDPASPLSQYLSSAALSGLRRNRNQPTGSKLGFFALDRFLRRFGNKARED